MRGTKAKAIRRLAREFAIKNNLPPREYGHTTTTKKQFMMTENGAGYVDVPKHTIFLKGECERKVYQVLKQANK